MKLIKRFVDMCAWSQAKRPADAPPRPRLFSRAWWSWQWAETKGDPVSSALGFLLILGGMAVLGLLRGSPQLEAGATRGTWQLFAVGLWMLGCLTVSVIATPRTARLRRYVLNYTRGHAGRAVALYLAIWAGVAGAGLGLTLGYIPGFLQPAIWIFIGLAIIALSSLATMLAVDGFSWGWRLMYGRRSKEAKARVSWETPQTTRDGGE